VEGNLAPTRLLIPVALALVASGPLRDALAGGGSTASPRYRWAAIVALAILGIAAGQALAAFNPVGRSFGARAASPPRDISEIWVMDRDGSHQTRLLPATQPGVDYSLPAWSPDGSRIAFTRWQNAPGVASNEASNQQSSSIWTMRADGSDLRLVIDGAPGADWAPAWSRDGATIAYTSTPNGPSTAGGSGTEGEPLPNVPPSGQVGPPPVVPRGDIWVVGADGAHPVQLTRDPSNEIAPAWSPDGSQIAFVSDRTGGDQIWAMGSDGSAPRQLTHGPGLDESPAWSPDGRRIAFASDRAGSWDIWVMDADGAHPTRLTEDPAQDWVPAWTPDGTEIVFTSDRSGEPEIWSMAADGSDPRDLSASPERVDGQWSVSVSPDGRRLAYASAAALPASDSALVTEDLAVAGTLLYAALLSIVALVALRLGAPFGSFALLLVANVAFAAVVSDQWRFLPAAALFGLATDVAMAVVRRSSVRRRPSAEALVAAVGLPLAMVMTAVGTLAVTGDLGWSPTLGIGVLITTVAIGSALALLTRRMSLPSDAPVVESAAA
jgi:TolB protein